ncbi:MAG: TonB-dependent receptor [Phocaeicola sp.]|nr:TonB-dependent receptor [Phocaeicola sp.]MDY5938165.1 TonB-dependent receptor [Phocaeicola sp.]
MRLRLFFFLLLISIIQTTTFAREIKGLIVDAENGEALPYASISIHSLPDSSVLNYTITKDDGSFFLENIVEEKNVYMRVSLIGYLTENYMLSAFKSLSDITIKLQPDRKLLNEVVVVGRKKLVSLTPQGVSYAMARDPKSQAEDLLTALRRVPMLTVDGLGKLMVKGGSNYSIYLNGKPFKSANLDPTQVLSSIPAANVQRIEIITNPDASYEAESGSTVINIVTQGRKILGQSLMLALQGETQPKANGSVGYNLITPRIKLTLAYDYNMNMQKKQPVTTFRDVKLPSTSSILDSYAKNDGIFQYHTGRVMLEAEIDSLNLLYADGHLRFTSTDYNLDWNKHYQSGTFQESIRTKNISNYQDGSVETNLLYKNLRKKDKQEVFSAGYRFAYSPDVRSQEGIVYQKEHSKFSKNTSEGGLWEHTLQVDATPIRWSGFTLKAGVTGTFRYGKSDPLYYHKSQENEEWQLINTDQYSNLRQNYRHIAGYANVNYRIKKWNFSAGARVEQSHSTISRSHSQEKTKEKYLNVIPRFSMTYQPNDATQIGFNYYSGVQRPSIWLLNPFVDKIDDYNSTTGNPYLKNNTTHSFGLNSLMIGEKLFAQVAIDYAITSNPIFRRRWLEAENPKLLYESYFNGSKSQSIIPSIMFNYNPTPAVSISAFGNIGGLFFYGDNKKLLQKNLIYNIQTNIDINLPKNVYIGGKYGYTQSYPTLGSENNHSHLYSFYITKRMMDGKLSVSLMANRPFQKYSEFRATDWGEGFRQHRSNFITARSFGLKLVYNFGIGDKRSVKRNNSLSTTDLDRSTGVR